MEAIRFEMRTAKRRRALEAARCRSSATAERSCREWERAGVFERRPHRASLGRANAAGAIGRGFLVVDGCHVEAPLSRAQTRGRVAARPAQAEAKWTAVLNRRGLVLSVRRGRQRPPRPAAGPGSPGRAPGAS